MENRKTTSAIVYILFSTSICRGLPNTETRGISLSYKYILIYIPIYLYMIYATIYIIITSEMHIDAQMCRCRTVQYTCSHTSLWSVYIAAGHIMFLYDSKHHVPVRQRTRSLWQEMSLFHRCAWTAKGNMHACPFTEILHLITRLYNTSYYS